MFKKIKSLFSQTPAPVVPASVQLPDWAQVTESATPVQTPAPVEAKVKKKRTPQKAKPETKPAEPSINAEKLAANAAGEPWVSVLGMDLDLANLSSGSFNLDWNDIFVARLIKAGYKGKSDVDIVDQWFQDICRNVVLETYQQEQADPDNRK